MDKSSINIRFVSVIDYLIQEKKAKNKAEIASVFGISPSKFSEILKGRMNAGTDLIAATCMNFPEISAEWLLSGSGSMIKVDTIASAHKVDCGGIPLIPISAMAGIASGQIDVMEYECERYVVPLFSDANFLITVKGSSMTPTYNSGDIVACKWLNGTNIFFQWNKVYVLDTDQGALIKRVHPGSEQGKVTLVSDNKDYTPFEIPLSSVHATALVIGVIRLE